MLTHTTNMFTLFYNKLDLNLIGELEVQLGKIQTDALFVTKIDKEPLNLDERYGTCLQIIRKLKGVSDESKEFRTTLKESIATDQSATFERVEMFFKIMDDNIECILNFIITSIKRNYYHPHVTRHIALGIVKSII